MAVCSVLEEHERDNRIVVNRVAGSSAGAIAAVMFASSRSTEEYKDRLKKIAPRYLADLKGGFFGFKRVIWEGEPFFGSFSLTDFFRDLFCHDNTSPKLLNELRIETQVYATNIYSLAAQPAAPSDPIPTALSHSCRIPYAFAGFNSDNHLVDGGLALNLPVDHMRDNASELGHVLGISFLSKFPERSKFASLLAYTGQLFNAAVQSNVNRSRALLGEANVFAIATSIDTFDFDEALDEGLGDKFDLVRHQFASWFEAWLRHHHPAPQPPNAYVYPVLNNSPFPGPVVEELREHYRSDKFTYALSMTSYDAAILRENGSFTGKYLSRFRNRYRVMRKTHILSFDFQTGKTEATFSDFKLRVMAIDAQAQPLKFATHVQELQATDNLRSFRLYLLFESALTPSTAHQPFTVDCAYEVDDPFPNLSTGSEILSFTRADGDADEITVVAAFPRELLRKNPKNTDISTLTQDALKSANFVMDTEMVSSEAMEPGDYISEMGLTSGTDKYIFAVRRAKNIKQGQTMGLMIE